MVKCAYFPSNSSADFNDPGIAAILSNPILSSPVQSSPIQSNPVLSIMESLDVRMKCDDIILHECVVMTLGVAVTSQLQQTLR